MESITQRDIDHLEKVGNYFDIHDDYYDIHERFYFIFDGDYIENVFLGYDHILAIDVDEYIDSIKTKEDERKLVKREFMSFMEEADFMYDLIYLIRNKEYKCGDED